MELWLIFVIIAQFINALVVLIDKYVVISPKLPNPVVYAFYVTMMSGIAIFAIPFGVEIPNIWVIVHSLAAAVCFLGSILALYLSFRKADASDIVPVIGAISALTSFVLSYFILSASLPAHFVWGFVLLVIGMFVISRFRFSFRTFGLMFISGFLFGASSVFIKFIFFNADFVNGFFWSRMANVAVAPLLFLIPGTFEKVFLKGHNKKENRHFGGLVVLSKTLAGVAFLFILGAIMLGDVSIVNALAGLQFGFLLLFAFMFNKYFPSYFNESGPNNRSVIINKLIGVAFVSAGFFMLFL